MPAPTNRLAHHTLLNLVGVGAPLLVGLLVMPTLTRSLGAERFGLLALGWVLVEYFALFDLGVGRAAVKSVAEVAGAGRAALARAASVALGTIAALGVLSGIALAASASPLVHHVLGVPAWLRAEAVACLLVLAATMPLVFVSVGLRAVLEGVQRFDLATLVRVPSSAATFAVPAIAAGAGASLPRIFAFMLVARVATVAALGLCVRRVAPGVRFPVAPTRAELAPLARFGRWVAVSNVASPILVYLDRFVLSAVAGLAAVGFYSAPYEAVTRLLIVPNAFITSLFPAVASQGSELDHASLRRLAGASVRNLALLLLPVVAVVVALAPVLLDAWLGPEFAERGATALRILAIGVFVNSLCFVPYICLHALERPDLTAKFHLLELALQVPMAWYLVTRFGIAGAAAAWAARVTVDTVLVHSAAWRVFGLSPAAVVDDRGARLLAACGGLAIAVAGAAAAARSSVGAAVALALVATSAFAAFAWWRVMDEGERGTVGALVRRRRRT